jgi:D-glycero-D-manno-heptose 1,7-bisphosphate phosphatase
LDRDGVLNYNVLNPATGEWESPHVQEDFKLFPWVIKSLQELQSEEFRLFLVSNQPSYAKGKTSLENIKAIQRKLHDILVFNKIIFTEYFYCYHHPKGIVPELSIKCACRKPGTFFVEQAVRQYSLDIKRSWMVGDRDYDIICGSNAGLTTIRVINTGCPQREPADCAADFETEDLRGAVEIIKNNVIFAKNRRLE